MNNTVCLLSLICVLAHRWAISTWSRLATSLEIRRLIMSAKPRPRVLCVDDDEDSRVMLSTLLRLALVEAKTVGTAAQALSLVQAERFDLYLMDTSLPDLDGFELCRRIRDFDPDTPILFFSGAAYETDRKKG